MNKEVAVFGSSSACCFKNLYPNTYPYAAASAKGLSNINSKSKVNQKIYSVIKLLRKNSDVFFLANFDKKFLVIILKLLGIFIGNFKFLFEFIFFNIFFIALFLTGFFKKVS